MLKRLSVANFAIIEDLTINFNDKMSVLTGETGAGKSLIIDTILLLLGGRADTDMIRFGEPMAQIEGEFIVNNLKLKECIINLGYKIDDTLIIKRELKQSGKNMIYINKEPATLQTLKNIATLLADIHVQNDTFRLFSEENYLDFIDPKDDDKFNNLLNEYVVELTKYLELLKKYNYILKNQNQTKEKLEYLKYEANELSALNLTKDIDLELEEKINKLKNFDKIYQGLKSSYEDLENEYFNLDSIYDAAISLEKIDKFSPNYLEYAKKVKDAYYILDDVKNSLYDELENLDFNADELNELEQSYQEIVKAKEKYKKDVNELISYLDKIKLEIAMVDDYDNALKEAYNSLEEEFKILKNKAKALSDYRKKLALDIEKGIIKECQDLELYNVDFAIKFNEIDLSDPLDNSAFLDNGYDVIDFLISLNKGEPKKSIAKVASGGEMSRIMLAFKAYFASKSNLELMVFDEIDTGISGSAAMQIALKMKQISKHTQVLCITHLPQVAAIGDYHYHIYKIYEDNRTKTQIELLDQEGRIKQIAMMLSGSKISKFALEHAKELLENKNKA